jgi:hypothetical protein
MAKGKKTRPKASLGGTGAVRKPRTPIAFNTLVDEYETGVGGPEPADVITQADLRAYMDREREIDLRLEEYIEKRRELMTRLWDGATVEDGPLAAGLLRIVRPTGQWFSLRRSSAGIRYGNLAGPHPWKKPLRLVVGGEVGLADACRLHGASKACPEGAEPIPPFFEVVNWF